jgi:hypothetical protein
MCDCLYINLVPAEALAPRVYVASPRCKYACAIMGNVVCILQLKPSVAIIYAEGTRLEPFCINDFIRVLFNVAICALNLEFIEISLH